VFVTGAPRFGGVRRLGRERGAAFCQAAVGVISIGAAGALGVDRGN